MKYAISIVLVVFMSTAAFADEWTKEDTLRESTYQFLAVMDWGMTRQIAKHPEKYHEDVSNRILGRHPHLRDVDVYMPLSMIGHYVISKNLPTEWHSIPVRAIWQSVTIGFKGSLVDKNIRVGLTVGF